MNARIARRLLAAAAPAAFACGAFAQTPPPAPPRAPAAAAEKKAEPSPAALKEGKALFAKFVDGLGGPAKVKKVHDVQTRGLVTAKTPQGDMAMDVQTAMVFPDRISQQVDAPFGRMSMVATPAGRLPRRAQRRPGPPAGHEGRVDQAGAPRSAASRPEAGRSEADVGGGGDREDRRRRGAHPRRELRRRLGPLVPRPDDLPHPPVRPHLDGAAGRGPHRVRILGLQDGGRIPRRLPPRGDDQRREGSGSRPRRVQDQPGCRTQALREARVSDAHACTGRDAESPSAAGRCRERGSRRTGSASTGSRSRR